MGGASGTAGSLTAGGSGGNAQSGGQSAVGGASGAGGAGGTSNPTSTAKHPFPHPKKSAFCTYPTNANNADVTAAYQDWKNTVVTADGAGGFLRVKKPDSGTVIGSTVSEGMGYGMLLAVYMDDQPLFDGLWKYEQLHLNGNGLMNWEIGPDGGVTAGGSGGATDGDEDMAFALVMADLQWGGRGTLNDTYLNHAKKLIDAIWNFEVDHTRQDMLKPGDQWGDVDVTNPSYFAPAYYRVFGPVTGKTAEWTRVLDTSYAILAKSLNTASGNADNGLVPAWCNSSGVPGGASGAPLNFQNDATRTPFRIAEDYCFANEPRAKTYLAKISSFYAGVGVANITNGYDLDGTPHPEKVFPAGLQAASFVGPAGVGAMHSPQYQTFIDQAYAELATLKLSAGTIYYQKSWTALSLLMLTGNLSDFSAP
jgi:endo-1,4-beta-D-glucanase Y